ncbi:MAG: YkgJ family cysteine cluster protein [Candidatus Ornithospirochaeta sp.]|nr:YkgJ family cysteine cluster protein [Candidatus Ornithospirochaeta sp.]
MEFVDKSEALFEGTIIGDQLKEINAFFSSMQSDLDSFVRDYGIECPPGCGTCCERFMPDITNLEALKIAVSILFSPERESFIDMLERNRERTEGPCALYNAGDPDHHCRVYSSRPLICRLFHSSCFSDKSGHPSFRSCRFGTQRLDISSMIKDRDVPVMGEYGRALEELPGNDEETGSLPEMVLSAIEKVRLYMSFLFPDFDGTDNRAM